MVKVDARTQFRVIVVTNPQTHTHPQIKKNPQTGPITIHCTAASAQCNKSPSAVKTDFKPESENSH